MRYHFIGIKGSGMSALATIVKKKGNYVQGSDTRDYIFTQENLIKNKIKILDFDKKNLNKIDVIICGHAFIDSNNEELLEAKEKKIKIYEYNEYIAKFIQDYTSIAVCGTHGKTTTTSLVYNTLKQRCKIGCLIGDGTSFINEKSDHFVFEACEYKDHFLVYKPNIIVINNIELDHVDYFKSEKQLIDSFFKFSSNAKNMVVINGDDNNLRCLKAINLFKFGLKSSNDLYVKKIKQDVNGISFDLYFKKRKVKRFSLPFYGKHMLYNSLAAISVGLLFDVDVEDIIKKLNLFKGVKKRFSETIYNDDVYIDDYAHHPSEIKATLAAVRQKYPNKKIIAFFKGDRYSRIKVFGKRIANELSKADQSYILAFPSSSEKEMGIDIDENYIASFSKKIKTFNETEEEYKSLTKEVGVVYLMMSSKNMLETTRNIQKYKG